MFGLGLKKGAALIETPPPAPAPQRPQKQMLRPVESDVLEDYLALCKDIRAETPAVRMLQFRQFLAERSIPEYSGPQVHAYLIQLAKTQVQKTGRSQTIFWYPLRKEDTGNQHPLWYAWGTIWRSPSDYGNSVSIEYTKVMNTIYHNLVPGSTLQTVKTILQVFRDAKFFVSDIAEVADPFLAVTFPGQMLMIIDFWDEPGFRPITK